MILKEKNNLLFFEFPNLACFKDIRHAVFTRKGGMSKGVFQSLNVGINLEDSEADVRQNRQMICQCMGNAPLLFVNQVHGVEIAIFSSKNKTQTEFPIKADAMITNMPGKNLLIQVADCQPVLLFDPQKKVAANVHSGWRSSIKNIVGKTVSAMNAHFRSNPAHIFAGIGPSLGPCCAEFIHFKKEIPKKYWEYGDNKHYFNFWAITRDQLQEAGVPQKQIHISQLCTKCRTDLFFSYRGEFKTGRFAAVIGIK